MVKGRNQMHRIEKGRKPLAGVKREELFLPIIMVLFSVSYIIQVWGEPGLVVLWPYIVMGSLLICTGAVVGIGLAGGWRQEGTTDTSDEGIWAWLRKGIKPLVITGTTIIYLMAT